MAVSPYRGDPFQQLNRVLDAPHTSTGSIRKACIAVQDCLTNNRDNLRGFFDKSFPNLLKRVFGYGDFEASWLNIVTKQGRDADARALVELLAPDGKLFGAMAQADHDQLVQYIFPTERLPAHTQELLKDPSGVGRRVLDTWPQYRGRLRQDAAGRPQVLLNVFEYFMFWSAFFVLRGSAGNDANRADPRSSSSAASYMYGIRSMGSAIVGNLILGRPAGTLQSHPYYRLLRTYLDYFLPRSVGGGAGGAAGGGGTGADCAPAGAAGSTGYGSSALGLTGLGGLGGGSPVVGAGAMGRLAGLSYGSGLGAGGVVSNNGRASYKPTMTAAAGGSDSRGAIVLSILLEFWLTDASEPLPSLATGVAAVAAAGGMVSGGGAAVGAMTPGMGAVGGGGMGAASPGLPAANGAMGVGGLPGALAGGSPAPPAATTPPSVRMLTYQPPSEELVEALVVLVRYVHVVEDARAGAAAAATGGGGASPTSGPLAALAHVGVAGLSSVSGGRGVAASNGGVRQPGLAGGGGMPRGAGPLAPAQQGRAPWLPETPIKTPPPPPPRLAAPPASLVVRGVSASPAVQAVSRKVYRQLRRAFSQWPPSSPTSLTPLITLWLSIIAPWCPVSAHTRKTSAVAPNGSGAAGATGGMGAADAAAGGGIGGGAAGAGGSTAAGGAGLAGAHHHHHMGAALGSAAAAAAAAVTEATAATLHLGSHPGGGFGRERDVVGAVSRELLSQYKYTPAWRGHVLSHLPFYLLLLPHFASLSLSRLTYRPDAALRDLDRVLAVLAAAGPELLRELRGAEEALREYARPAAAGGRRRSEGELGELLPWWLEQAQDFEASASAGSSPPGAVAPDLGWRLFGVDAGGAAHTACLVLRSAETLGRPELVCALRQSASAVLPLGAVLPAAVGAEQAAAAVAAGMDEARFPRPGRWRALSYRGDPLLRPIASNELPLLVRPLVRASRAANAALGLDVPYCEGEEEANPPEHLGHVALLWARKRGYRINLRIFAEVQVLAWLLLLGLLLWATRGVFLGGGAGAGTGAGAGGGSRAPPMSYGAAAGTGTAARYGGGPYDYQQQHVRQAYVQRQQQQQQAGAGAPADGGYRF